MRTTARFFFSLLLSILFLPLLPSTGQATTVKIPSDDEMIIGARAIVEGRVMQTESAYDAERGMVFTYTTVAVDDALKGPFTAGQQIVLKEMGGQDGSIGTRIYGSPTYRRDERVLLYLTSWPDGSLRTYQMFLGKFIVRSGSGRTIVERDKEEGEVDVVAQSLAGPTTESTDLRAYKKMVRKRLRANLDKSEEHEKQYYNGQPLLDRPPDYNLKHSRGDIHPMFTLLGNPPVRWFENSVTFSIFPDGAPDGVQADIDAAFNAWSSVSGVGISITTSGTSANCGNLNGQGNVVTFNNCGGWFAQEGCANILALAGILRYDTSQRTTVNGQDFVRALQGFLAMNPSASCYFGDRVKLDEVLTHETGHALGLGHSQYNDATMFAFAHFDGRGASLRQDDMDGILYVYPASGGGGDPGPPRISTTTINDGQVGSPYEFAMRAAGGFPPYAWSKSGTLPAGLSINGGGIIRGTPTTEGTYSFTVVLNDAHGGHDQKDFSLKINPSGGGGGLQITTGSLPDGNVSTVYSFTLIATGGSTPYSWSLQTGQLPAGLSLNPASGAITGTPTQSGTFPLTFRVTDFQNSHVDKALNLNVTGGGGGGGGGTLTITTNSLPNGQANTPYSQTLSATGGISPYSWVVISGQLPAGLTLSAGGRIGGTPTVAGNYSFTVRVADSGESIAQKPFTLNITGGGGGGPLSITTTTVAIGPINSPYLQTLVATGGTLPYSWTLGRGQLPAGVMITQAGQISGTPTIPGEYSFTARVNDSAGASAQKSYTLTITGTSGGCSGCVSGDIDILIEFLPQGYVGEEYWGKFSPSKGTAPFKWTVLGGSFPPGLRIANTGEVTGTPSQYGQFQFLLGVTDSTGLFGQRMIVIDVIPVIPKIRIVNNKLPDAEVGKPYLYTFQVTGGVNGTPAWSLASGGLPPGITLSSDGKLSGTPTADGSFTFSVSVSVGEASDTASFTLHVLPSSGSGVGGLQITTATLPPASSAAPYSVQLAASGGAAPYAWSMPRGQRLPDGFSLSADGKLTGNPKMIGNFTLTVQVMDAQGAVARKQFDLSVNTITGAGGVRIITPSLLDDAVMNGSYKMKIGASGGGGGYQWAVTNAFLPAGLSLDRYTGEISGMPDESGRFVFVATAFDSAFNRADKVFELNVIEPGGGGLLVTSQLLPDAAPAAVYNFTLSAAGGKGSYKWVVTGGQLPDGLTLDPRSGILSGKPTKAGLFRFTATVRDKSGNQMGRSFELLVAGGPTPEGPVITAVTYKAKKGKMVVSGDNFGDGPSLFVDGIQVKSGQGGQDNQISMKNLALAPGPHILVVQNVAGARSPSYMLVVQSGK